VPELPLAKQNEMRSTRLTPEQNFSGPIKKRWTHRKTDFCPIKNRSGQFSSNQRTHCESAKKNFRPTKSHAWHGTVPSYTVNMAHQRKDVPHTHSTSHAHSRKDQRLKKCNNDRNERADTDDRYLSQLKSLTHQHQQDIMKTPSIIKKLRNPVFKTPSPTPHKLSSAHKDVKYLTPALLEQSNIKLLIGAQRVRHQAKLHKRDAVIAVQTQFFTALRNLYTWPMDSLILANIIEVKDFWNLQLQTARTCSYKAETIDPNHHGELRYDIMAEIVKLESIRINDFMHTFQHYHDEMHQEGDITDHFRCDNEMLAHFDTIQANVILDIPPQWVEESRRPPLTWYTFLSPSKFATSPYRTKEDVIKERILAPEYYDSSGSNSS
jgi:hypothetical protein